jgi:CRISPR-associated protein Cmr2
VLTQQDYRRKLYVLLKAPELEGWGTQICNQLACLEGFLGNEPESLTDWWNRQGGKVAQEIGASSDRINLQTQSPETTQACHPISGQKQTLHSQSPETLDIDIEAIKDEPDPKKVFWWFWRFYPELLAQQYPDALLYPAHSILPDCPLHSHQSTVSALVGALSNSGAEQPEEQVPYLLLFSFSPVQEFIKASRKFVDFWAGSYLLHYLSARLCWYVAQQYGPDAVIVPSLWNQEIFDALMLEDSNFASFEATLRKIAHEDSEHKTPVERFENGVSNSLSTAGFPNMITVLVPGKRAAEQLGQTLGTELKRIWQEDIGAKIQRHVRDRVISFLTSPDKQTEQEQCWSDFVAALPRQADRDAYRREWDCLKQASCWEWRHLWEAQLENTWEPYWSAVPLGMPGEALEIAVSRDIEQWTTAQNQIAWPPEPLPSQAEATVYTQQLNVGTWWGSLQQRLRVAHQATKNTRHWQIPVAPGTRSTLSGQFSALHPRLNYQVLQRNGKATDFRQGGGLPEGSMRLFWSLMSYAYKGLFNGSEMLNALELTKRMAWQFGGVAESLGVNTTVQPLSLEALSEDIEGLRLEAITDEIDYEQIIRFPNLSSIAAARFMYESFNRPNSKLRQYWTTLRSIIGDRFPNAQHRYRFAARTKGRPTQVLNTDRRINPNARAGHNYNGVMFSAKWLADEMQLEKAGNVSDKVDEVAELRAAISSAHRAVGFGEGSPGDWWVIVLGDGDGMGSYISGKKLHPYKAYLPNQDPSHYQDGVAAEAFTEAFEGLLNTPKRMGPATHIGLNRALLDFSNRLVPYLTEQRYCGRVVYSGGDDVMAVLPLEDLPGYLRSLRAAWCGNPDPEGEFDRHNPSASVSMEDQVQGSGYWYPKQPLPGVSERPHFTMGQGATMSLGIVIAYKTVPLPTVLESLWSAEKTAKDMPNKDGLCFRVIYGGGNTLQALMTGHLLEGWWQLVQGGGEELSPLLYRLAEELPRRATFTEGHYLFARAAEVITRNRDQGRQGDDYKQFCDRLSAWLHDWEDWAGQAKTEAAEEAFPLGATPEDLGYLLRFSAFWVDKITQRQTWLAPQKQGVRS